MAAPKDIWEASAAGDVEAINDFLADPEVRINVADSRGRIPLGLAAKNRHADAVRALLSGGADVNVSLDKHDTTPLMLACSKNHSDIVLLLVEAGADVRTVANRGATPLSTAVKEGHGECVELLLAAGAILPGDSVHDGYSAVLEACSRGRVELFDTLVLAGARVADESEGCGGGSGGSGGGGGGDGGDSAAEAYNNNSGDSTTTTTTNATNRNSGNTNNAATPTTKPARFTALLAACAGGNVELVSKVLSHAGVDPDARTKAGETTLMLSAKMGHAELVRVLVDAGADVLATDKSGYTALLHACVRGQVDTVRALVEALRALDERQPAAAAGSATFTANNSGDESAAGTSADGGPDSADSGEGGASPRAGVPANTNTPAKPHGNSIDRVYSVPKFDVPVSALLLAVHHGHSELAEYLLETGGATIDTGTPTSANTLFAAVTKDYPGILAVLTDHGADVAAVNADGETALMLAFAERSYGAAQFLLDAGCPATGFSRTSYESVLHVVHRSCPDDLCEALVAAYVAGGGDLDARSSSGYTALVQAIRSSAESLVFALIKHGADVDAHVPGSRDTPLMVASELKMDNVISALVAAGANVNAKNAAGHSALWSATSAWGNIRVVDILLDAGADVSGFSLTDIGVLLGMHGNRVEGFLEWAAKLAASGAAMCDPHHPSGFLLLSTCRSSVVGHVAAVLDAGADIHVRGEYGTPLILMASYEIDLTLRLLSEGADVNDYDRYGVTALHCAAQWNSGPLCAALIAAGAAVKAVDTQGRTPLASALDGYLSVQRELLCAGADVFIGDGWWVNRSGETFLQTHARYNPDVAALFAEFALDGGDEWDAAGGSGSILY